MSHRSKRKGTPSVFQGYHIAELSNKRLLEQQMKDLGKPHSDLNPMADKDGQYFCPKCETKEMVYHRGKDKFVCLLCKHESEIAFKEKIMGD
jgi:hypothetical protein